MDVSAEAKSRPLCTLSVFSFIPARRTEPKEMRYFNTISKTSDISTDDHECPNTEGYDNKLHRDDRKHAKGRNLDIFSEESSRPVPVLSSSVYGRFSSPHHDPGKRSPRVSHIRSDFYSKNGITMEGGYGSVKL
nr:uncharacterized protein CFAP90 [Misgurnus anguillicaudatus]